VVCVALVLVALVLTYDRRPESRWARGVRSNTLVASNEVWALVERRALLVPALVHGSHIQILRAHHVLRNLVLVVAVTHGWHVVRLQLHVLLLLPSEAIGLGHKKLPGALLVCETKRQRTIGLVL